MVHLVYYLTKLLFFDIPLLYYYINLTSSINFCLFSGDIYLSFGISISKSCIFCFTFNCFWTILWWGFWDFSDFSEILLSTKSPVASAVFWIALFEVVLSASVVDFLAWLGCFWVLTCLSFYLYFLYVFAHIFSKRQQSITFYKILGHFLYVIL